jgi:hypothetical protein
MTMGLLAILRFSDIEKLMDSLKEPYRTESQEALQTQYINATDTKLE